MYLLLFRVGSHGKILIDKRRSTRTSLGTPDIEGLNLNLIYLSIINSITKASNLQNLYIFSFIIVEVLNSLCFTMKKLSIIYSKR